ncbi:MAG: sigma-70 family RNA polymerase sigma factor [Lapillicoccus sp.]
MANQETLSETSSVRDLYAAREARTRQLLADAAATTPGRRQRLREQAWILNQPMALGVARKYHGRGLEGDDIDQVALLALWKAVLGYVRAPGIAFASYAIPTITGEIKRHFRDRGWLVRPTRGVQERSLAFTRAIATLRQELGREPDDHHLTRYLDITPTELACARQAQQGYHGHSLGAPLDGTTHTLADTLPDHESAYDVIDTRLTLREAINGLSERDRRLLHLRYVRGLTQTDIGAQLGLSQMHVSRLLRRIHGSLQGTLTAQAS